VSGWSRVGLIAAACWSWSAAGRLTIRLTAERVAPPIELATAMGVRADHVLSDASTVRLNADSHASVAYGRAAATSICAGATRCSRSPRTQTVRST
jgi:transmembrane sensor